MRIRNFDFIEALKAYFFPRDRDITLQEGRTITVTASGGVSVVIDSNGIVILNGDVTIDGTSVSITGHTHTHASTTGQGTDDHHNEAHTVTSHSDTTATGSELNTLTDGSNADLLHDHTHSNMTGQTANDHHNEAHTVASHSDTTATGAELETLTDGSNADALHAHTHSSMTGQTANDHHNEAHTVASHSDTTATGSELNTLTDGSNADALHAHAVGSHTIVSHSDTSATGSELNTLTDGSDASSLHDHDGRYFQQSEFTNNPGSGTSPLKTASGILQIQYMLVTEDMKAGSGVVVGGTTQSPGDGILFIKEAAGPPTPPSGFGLLTVSTSGKLWFKDDTGTATNLTP